MAWIAIDAGTTVIKAIAFSDTGKELALARASTELLRPHKDYSEQNPLDVWRSVVSVVRQVVERCAEPITGIVSTAQGDGCWLVDSHGNPVRNAILWNDGRAHKIIERWHKEGIIDHAFGISGSASYAGLPNAILSWLSQHEPQTLVQARWVLTCNGWLFSRMTGRSIADLSDASNPFCDVKKRCYSDELLKLFGLERYMEKLPPISQADDLIATLTPTAAQQMGIPIGTPVLMAPYDIVTTAIGCGVNTSTQACVILGTTICTETILPTIDLDQSASGTTIALEDGQFLRAMPTLTGCEALRWGSKLLANDDQQQLQRFAQSACISKENPFFLPYLSSAGERAPFLEPKASGSFHNLSFHSSPSQICHALYEGLTFVIRECLERTSDSTLQDVRVSGGGANSDLWCQMIADVIGVNVIRPGSAEHGARGAFLWARTATSQTDSSLHLETEASTFTPRAHENDTFTTRYKTWLSLRDSASSQWRVLRGDR
ncbi:FGGY-family carbohydrate kinase [Edaphobacter sp. 12200R-103]|uniref:FGGY-family carbohydrate kinase n=1 Tax=Edaphobacter sp. 12200R-103 TaxID=2703788 RepID=UPI00138C5043|nr:FGGY-family carbohydrate kinase [Edaphobacter sp. 12200R-103]QHS53090.1 carbohydrate kinase [Edaphobacter sp. 12200R-103]